MPTSLDRFGAGTLQFGTLVSAVEHRHAASPAAESLNKINQIVRTLDNVAHPIRLYGDHGTRGPRRDQRAGILAPVPAPAEHMGGIGIDHLAGLRRLRHVALLRHVEEAV